VTTSGTTDFNLNFTEIAEEAFELAGRPLRSGYDLRTARRSMNLLTVEWVNRGLNLWTVDEGEIDLVEGVAEYDLPADTVDLMDMVIRTGAGNETTQADLTISRISFSTYSSIPNKLTQARPIQVWVRRLETPAIVVWPVPNQSDYYVFKYWRMRRIQDAGSGVETPDISFRFLPALTAGLAWRIASKIPEGADRIAVLKEQYEEQYLLAGQEDRDRSPVRFVPRKPWR